MAIPLLTHHSNNLRTPSYIPARHIRKISGHTCTNIQHTMDPKTIPMEHVCLFACYEIDQLSRTCACVCVCLSMRM